MQRRAYALLVGNALLVGAVAIIVSHALGEPLRDPDGFLGPAWFRIPAMVAGAFLIDIVPRAAWRSRFRVDRFFGAARGLVREHWTGQRIALVIIGVLSFYMTYVSYRNLKNFLPFIGADPFYGDRALHEFDRFLMFGNEPSVVLHNLLGSGFSAHLLDFVYLLFLPIAPLSVVYFLVWSKNINVGYWYATANGLAWTLGTVSYYALPSLGPAFAFPWLYVDLDTTGVTSLQNSLWNSRSDVLLNPFADSISSVAGFASLHVGIILTLALVAHYTIGSRAIRGALWVLFLLTVVSTLYFGWHYIADDLAGVLIAVLSVWLAGLATGQRFERWGLSVRSSSDSAYVPVHDED
jgi:hypothetical protein